MRRCKNLNFIKLSKKWKGVSFLLPSLLGTATFVVIPFLDVVRRSFRQSATEEWVGVANYQTVIDNEAFRLAVYNTLHLLLVSVPILTALSLLIAVLLRKQTKIDLMLKSCFLVPMAVPVASVAFLWSFLFDDRGFVNGLLTKMGTGTVNWMNTSYAFGVLVFSFIWKNLGYMIVLWLAGLAAISKEIYEAARVDGAGEWQCFWKIVFPNLKPTAFIVLVLSFINGFKVFREVYLVAGEYPDKSIYMLQHLFNNWFRDMELDKMAAGAVLTVFLIFLLIWVVQKILMGGSD